MHNKEDFVKRHLSNIIRLRGSVEASTSDRDLEGVGVEEEDSEKKNSSQTSIMGTEQVGSGSLKWIALLVLVAQNSGKYIYLHILLCTFSL